MLHVRFEKLRSTKRSILHHHSTGLKPLDYLSRHVFVSEARKLMFDRAFNRHREESIGDDGPRYLPSGRLLEALGDVMGRGLEAAESEFLERSLGGELPDRLDFRTWCGVCAFAERALPELPPRELDPAPWLERADFESLERRLASVRVDEGLATLLRIIRDR